MNKIEALKYICDNYHGSDGGFQIIITDIIITVPMVDSSSLV